MSDRERDRLKDAGAGLEGRRTRTEDEDAATMATARQIAAIFFIVVTRQVEYEPKFAFPDQPDAKARQFAALQRKAKRLGVTLVFNQN